MALELNSFLEEIDEETKNCFENGNLNSRSEAFSEYIISEIKDAINVDEFHVCHGTIKDNGSNIRGEIYAYGISANTEVLTLFYTEYDSSSDYEPKNLPAANFQTTMNRMQGFYNSAVKGLRYELDEEDPLFEPSKFIDSIKDEITSIRLCLLSNYNINVSDIRNHRILDKNAFPEVWDLKKLYTHFNSGLDRVPINVNFKEEYKKFKIPYIEMDSKANGYKCFITLFPGELLYNLYEKYNTDLLSNNVRYFLGFKGSKRNANKGILKTLREESHMFLAYNNGITATAEDIDVSPTIKTTDISQNEDDGRIKSNNYIKYGILEDIKDFQIVNGGQTTASLFFAKKSDKNISLSGVYVQVKIVILDSDLNNVASKITEFSNSQSQIKLADFTVGNKYNMMMEDLSRRMRIPTYTHDATYWFFERVRGQYDQMRKNKKTPAEISIFNSQYPKEYKFKKELIAKVWKSWNQEPFDAVKGEATNYDSYMKTILDTDFIPNETYYKQTIALIIIYTYLYDLPEMKEYKNKKASVIAYTIAYLNYISFKKYDLVKVWESQKLSDNTKSYLRSISASIQQALTSIADADNTTVLSEGKKKATYDEIKNYGIKSQTNLIREDLLNE
jgi:hypothetical protein